MTKTFEEQINELAQPVQQVIKEAFDKKLAEAKELAYEQARVELSEKYKADMEALIAGSEAMIKESIEEKCSDIKKLEEQKLDSIKKVNEALKAAKKMIAESLAKELVGVREEKKHLNEKLAEMDKFVKDSLVEHVEALQEEKQKYIKASAKVIEEGIELQESAKQNFIKVATEQVANVVFENMNESIDSLKAEIKEAQQNEFGKRLFEMFSGEFKALFLNENAEIQKERAEKAKLEESVAKARLIVENKNSQIESLKEKLEEQKSIRQREAIIAEATKGLSAKKCETLKKMVESVATDKLEKVIKDYIPAVLGSVSAKKFVEEKLAKPTTKLTIKTGDKVVNESVNTEQVITPKNVLNEEIENIGLDIEYMDRMLGL